MSVVVPICMYCRRYDAGRKDVNACQAYPGPTGIPEPILRSEVDHRRPHRGDHGLRFDPVDSDAADYAEHVFRQHRAAVDLSGEIGFDESGD